MAEETRKQSRAALGGLSREQSLSSRRGLGKEGLCGGSRTQTAVTRGLTEPEGLQRVLREGGGAEGLAAPVGFRAVVRLLHRGVTGAQHRSLHLRLTGKHQEQ